MALGVARHPCAVGGLSSGFEQPSSRLLMDSDGHSQERTPACAEETRMGRHVCRRTRHTEVSADAFPVAV